MSRLVDMTGKRIGHITVLYRSPHTIYKSKRVAWVCRCDCGKEFLAEGTLLRRGYYSSCGCMRAQRLHDIAFKHGMTNTRLFKIWSCMKQRCYYQKYIDYYAYGGRGIKVCDEWLHSFQAFAHWASTSGYNDSLSIDRINVDGDYTPQNCRWATDIEQANNRHNNHYLLYHGEKHSLAEWSRIKNISYAALKSRIALGWSVEDALERPVRKLKRK